MRRVASGTEVARTRSMTHTQPACSPMQAAMLPVAARTAANSTPTAKNARNASLIESGSANA